MTYDRNPGFSHWDTPESFGHISSITFPPCFGKIIKLVKVNKSEYNTGRKTVLAGYSSDHEHKLLSKYLHIIFRIRKENGMIDV